MNRRVVLGVAAAVGLVAALWYILVPINASLAGPGSNSLALPLAMVESPARIPGNATGAVAFTAVQDEDGKGWFATDSLSTVAARYHAMRDKRRFVDLALKAGGGAHLAYAGFFAEARCAGVSGKPGAIAAQRRRLETVQQPSAREQALARRYEGCEGFESRPIGDLDYLSMVATFLGASDPAARGLRLLKEDDPEKIRREAGALLSEGDLHLAALVASSIARIVLVPVPDGANGAGGKSQARLATRDEEREEDSAWTLAWCRMGVSCDKDDGPVWANACYYNGHCRDDFAEAAERDSHKGRFDAVLARSQVIEKAIRDRNWRSLGF